MGMWGKSAWHKDIGDPGAVKGLRNQIASVTLLSAVGTVADLP